MVSYDPESRPTLKDIREHAWMVEPEKNKSANIKMEEAFCYDIYEKNDNESNLTMNSDEN